MRSQHGYTPTHGVPTTRICKYILLDSGCPVCCSATMLQLRQTCVLTLARKRCCWLRPACLQRDYLAAWLALSKPLAAPGQTPVGHPSAVSTWQAVAADAVRVGRAVLQKYNGHVIGVRFCVCNSSCQQLLPDILALQAASFGQRNCHLAAKPPLQEIVMTNAMVYGCW